MLVEIVAEVLEQLRLVLSEVYGLQTIAAEMFFFRPFILLVVLGITAGVVSVIVNLQQLEFNTEATVHAIFPGIVAGAVFLGIEKINVGAAVVGVFVVAALTWNTWRKTEQTSHSSGKSHAEAGTAIILTSFFAVGVVLSLKKGDMSGQLEALMYGRLLEVTDERAVQSIIACLIALCALGFTWRRQIFVAFDRDGARVSGINIFAIDFVANMAIAAVVIAGASAIGTLLVIGYLIVPGAVGKMLCSHTRTMCIVSMFVGVLGGYAGMLFMNLPSSHPISPQGTVALSVVGIFFVSLGVRAIFRGISKHTKIRRIEA